MISKSVAVTKDHNCMQNRNNRERTLKNFALGRVLQPEKNEGGCCSSNLVEKESFGSCCAGVDFTTFKPPYVYTKSVLVDQGIKVKLLKSSSMVA